MEKLKCAKPINKLLDDDNRCITNNQEITEEFNEFFLNISPALANKIPSSNICHPVAEPSSQQNSFFRERIFPMEV